MQDFIVNSKRKILFCVGAGASQESGVPTFRDVRTGYWARYDPSYIASITALELNPSEVNKFYNERRQLLGKCEPNYFHLMVEQMQNEIGKDRLAVVTTNVDDFFERVNIENLYKIHGNLTEIINFDGEVKNIGYEALAGEDLFSCRPNVVMFGEGRYMIDGKYQNAYSQLFKVMESMKSHDLIVIVGSSNKIVDFSELAYINYNRPKVCIVNTEITNDMIKTANETIIKRTACDSVPYIYDLFEELLND